MYKVGIVDDEKYVLKSIAKRIEYARLNLEVCGTARNAEEALDLYDRIKPDIFFVDIHLPSADGFELIRQIKNKDPKSNTKFIIVSGYDDFEHLHSAIRLGAVNYIRKPFQQKEFTCCLKELCVDLGREKNQREMDDVLQHVQLWQTCMKKKGNEIRLGTMILIHGDVDISRNRNFLRDITDVFGNTWEKIKFSTTDNLLLLYYEGESIQKNDLEAKFKTINLPVECGVIYHNQDELSPGVRTEEIEKAYYTRFTRNLPRILNAWNAENQFPTVNYDGLDIALEDGSDKGYILLIKEYMKKATEGMKERNNIKQVYQSIVLLIADKYRKYSLQLPEVLKWEFYPFALADCRTIDELTGKLVTYSITFRDKVAKLKAINRLSDEVERYLEMHYSEDINLDSLAREFFVPPAYLAKRFRDMKNITIMQRLKQLRMEKAKEFLEITNLSVTEIADKIGYNDSNYFTRMFRKAYNISPSEYRNKLC